MGSYSRYKVIQLKSMLNKLGESTTGRKVELIKRYKPQIVTISLCFAVKHLIRLQARRSWCTYHYYVGMYSNF